MILNTVSLGMGDGLTGSKGQGHEVGVLNFCTKERGLLKKLLRRPNQLL